MKTKNDYRKYAKDIRAKLDINDISHKIYKKCIELSQYKSAKNIFIYNSFSNEICTQRYFKDKTKNWYIPKVTKDSMVVCKYTPDKLQKSCYGIMEPATGELKELDKIDLIIIPALCADKSGYRVGYGKGYYDKFLSSLSHLCPKITLVPNELLFEKIPNEKFDIKCDIIITQSNIYNISYS